MHSSIASTLLIASLLSACGESSNDGSGAAGSAGSAGGAGAAGNTADSGGAGAAGTAGTGGADAGPSDEDLLMACTVPEPCQGKRSFAQLIENSTKYVDPNTACLFRALRDRTPGRYTHQADATWSNGSAGTEHVLVVAADGSVAHAGTSYASGPSAPSRSPIPGQRCQLKPAAYFDACADAIDGAAPDNAAAFECAYGSLNGGGVDWFMGCQDESPLMCQ